MARSRSGRFAAIAALLIVAVVIGGLAVSTLRKHLAPLVIGTGCMVRASYSVPLTTDQAGIAATIAAVAQHRKMPRRAVAIAYATALQESNLTNLPYGDRDSVGVFQQRPSQGWGSRSQLLDPVFASGKFFSALAQVRGYLSMPIFQAAQEVQHSADGSAYDQWADQGTLLASGFTGAAPRAVWCWYGTGVTTAARLGAAAAELSRSFGQASQPITLTQASTTTAGMATVTVRHRTAGWAVSSWLVTHASQYGIRKIKYGGYVWTSASGQSGWTRDATAGHQGATASAVAFG